VLLVYSTQRRRRAQRAPNDAGDGRRVLARQL